MHRGEKLVGLLLSWKRSGGVHEVVAHVDHVRLVEKASVLREVSQSSSRVVTKPAEVVTETPRSSEGHGVRGQERREEGVQKTGGVEDL
jgi:hypothetical protein